MGMRRAKLEGKRIGRAPLQVNRAALLADRERGMSLNALAKAHAISKASVCRVLKE
jgi:DNA invertase Pin-like site-specific DNA recombinase